MSDVAPLRRLPRRAIAAEFLRNLPALAGLIAVGATILLGSLDSIAPVVLPILAFLIAIRCLTPIVTWLRVRFATSQDQVAIETGLLAHRRVTARHDGVLATSTEQPWSHRLFGLVIVTLHLGGETTHGGVVVLPGVDADIAAGLRDLGARGGGIGTAGVAAGGSSDEMLYRATPSELLAAGASRGTLVLAGSAGILSVVGLIDEFQLSHAVWQYAETNRVLMLVLAVALVIVIGALTTLIRFHGFEVRRIRGGFVLSHGLIERHRRHIDRRTIVGARIQRNIPEMLFDRVRVELLTLDSTNTESTNLVLPSLPRTSVTAFLTDLDAALPPSPLLQRPGRHALRRSIGLVVLGVGSGIACAIALVSLTSLAIALVWAASLGAAVIVVRLVRPFLVRWRLRESHVEVVTHAVAERFDVVRVDAVHLVERWGVGRVGRGPVAIRYFAGGSRTIRVPVGDFGEAARLARAVEASARDVSISRMSRRRVRT